MSQSSAKPNHQQAGFTLTEILIVIAILAILGTATLILINPLTQIFKGYDAVRRSDLHKIKIAFDNYLEDHGCYPGDPAQEDVLPSFKAHAVMPGNLGWTISYDCNTNELSPYLESMPCDPNTKENYKIFTNTSYVCPQNYSIYATLANKFDPGGDKVPGCPDTIVAASETFSVKELYIGCTGNDRLGLCQFYYYRNPDGVCTRYNVEWTIPSACPEAGFSCSNTCAGIDPGTICDP